ncbi:Uncharacterized protein Adt_18709 [Abeliophyllum distichum]|uniref:Uncharacterized protein n=1 Tax=Abeliophyllum distichum TaxID=126358 RepID=A0ABD1TK65_9LAMI
MDKNARIGTIARPTYETSATNEDPKANMARRYKELCRLQTQIATRGSETEEAYNIVIHGFNNILEDIDAITSTRHLHSSTSSIMHNRNYSNIVDGVGIIMGIKRKGRVRGSSGKPKNALEKGKKKKKICPSSTGMYS